MAPDEGTPDEGLVEPVAPDSATPPELAPVESVSKADLSELRDEFKGWIDNSTERTKQSQRDAIKARVPQLVRDTIKEEFEAIEKYAPKEKQKELQIEAMMNHLTSEDSEPEEKPASSRPDESTVEREVRGVLEQHGLSGSEPELKQYMAGAQEQSMFEMLTGLDKVAVEVAEKRKATPAGILPSGSSPPPTPDLDLKFKEEMWAARGQGNAVGKAIKEKYRELGVEVDLIGFGPGANP